MQAIWPGLLQRHGAILDNKFDTSTLAHISDEYSSGTIDQVASQACRVNLQKCTTHCLARECVLDMSGKLLEVMHELLSSLMRQCLACHRQQGLTQHAV